MSRNSNSRKRVTYDRDRYTDQREAYTYVYGNTVRKLEPERVWEEQEEAPAKKPHH